MATFGEYLATGSGLCEFRVVIEGCPIQPCTSHAMAGVLSGDGFEGATVAGCRRVGGLLRDGLSFSESAYLPGADYKASLGSMTIEDTDESVAWNLRAASAVFSKVPRTIGFLRSSAASEDTQFAVRDASAFTVGRVYHIDTEAFEVTSVDTGTNVIGVTRGMWGTTAQGHFVSTTATGAGDRTLLCQIWDAVPSYRRRRVWIYGHGPENLGLTDVGTLVARGVISGAPSLSDGTTWSLSIAPLTTLLETDLGPREGELRFRGIYYPGASPLRITATRRADANSSSDVDSQATITVVGFFETQAAFCDYVTATLNADTTVATWGCRFSARPVGAGWELFVRTPAATTRYVAAEQGSVVDGIFDGLLEDAYAAGTLPVSTVSASTEYRCRWHEHWGAAMGYRVPLESVRGVPRGQYYAWTDLPSTASDISNYPWFRYYLGAVAGIQVDDIIRIDMPELEGFAPSSFEVPVASVSSDNGYVQIDPDRMRAVVGGVRWLELVPALQPKITISRNYGSGIHFADFLAAVYVDAVNNANAGTVPFILEGDFAPFADIEAAVLEAAAGRSWLLSRDYRYSKAVRFSDIVRHECRLYGLFMATDTAGAITFRPLSASLDEDVSIASSDLVNDASLGEIVIEPDGVVTGLTLRTGYDASEDEHKGQVFEVTYLGALSTTRTRTALEVAPKSRPTGTEPDYEELLGHLQSAFGLWSRQRVQITVDVRATFYAATIGDTVFATIPALPYDGERGDDGGGGGIVSTRGVIVARSWQLAEPALSLTIVFDSLDIAGYTPTGRVLSQSGSALAWTVTLDAAEYGPGGAVSDASFFATGMRVRLVEWDRDSPHVVFGTVQSVSGDDVTLAMDSTWAPASSTWILIFSTSDDSAITAAQLRYAWIAGAYWRVYLYSGTQATRMLAP